jgi:hypothetical protein
MHLQSIFKVISFFAVGQVLVRALPTDGLFGGLDGLDSLIVPCDDISKYTVQVSCTSMPLNLYRQFCSC